MKFQLEFVGSDDSEQQKIRDKVLIYLFQGTWEILREGVDSAADGWEPLPAKAQKELEEAYRSDTRLISVATATNPDGKTNLHTMMHTQTKRTRIR